MTQGEVPRSDLNNRRRNFRKAFFAKPSIVFGNIFEQIEAAPAETADVGGWSGGFANQAHWDPARPHEWRCWAQSGPTWSAHCGKELPAEDSLGLCKLHRDTLFNPQDSDSSVNPENSSVIRMGGVAFGGVAYSYVQERGNI